MSGRTTRLSTWWTGAEAAEIIDLLDQLRDELWNTYHEQILAHDQLVRIEAHEDGDVGLEPEPEACQWQQQLPFEDEEPF